MELVKKILVVIALGLSLSLLAITPVTVSAADCGVNADGKVNTGAGAGGGTGCAQSKDGSGDSTVPEALFSADGKGIVNVIINVVLFIVGALSVIMLIYGGIKYTTSAGDTAKVTSAKNTIMYAIVGLVVAILAFAIVSFITTNLKNDKGSYLIEYVI
jgi:hypothetical protein